MSRIAIFIVAVAGLMAANAQAVTFSFASDDNADGPTFMGTPVLTAGEPDDVAGPSFMPSSGDVIDGRPIDGDGEVFTFLSIDLDEDGPVDVLYVPALFEFEADFTSYAPFAIGGMTAHNYTMDGSFKFYDAASEVPTLLMEVVFTGALFTSFGPDAGTWGQTATIQGSESATSSVSITITPDLIIDDESFGPLDGTPIVELLEDRGGSEDFAFTLTNVRSLFDGDNVGIFSEIGLPFDQWAAEGSFSAHQAATFVPEPASLALVAIGGVLVAWRRRRGR